MFEFIQLRATIKFVYFLIKSVNADKSRTKQSYTADKVFVAIYDYDARTDEDLTFRVGDLLIILDDRFIYFLFLSLIFYRKIFVLLWNFSQSDWWLAKDYKTGLKGYIPALYVAPHGGLDVNE